MDIEAIDLGTRPLAVGGVKVRSLTPGTQGQLDRHQAALQQPHLNACRVPLVHTLLVGSQQQEQQKQWQQQRAHVCLQMDTCIQDLATWGFLVSHGRPLSVSGIRAQATRSPLRVQSGGLASVALAGLQ